MSYGNKPVVPGSRSVKIILFLLQAKCPVITAHLEIDWGNSVLVRNRSVFSL
jgi:uncharacterized protein with ATP-grasp and redox domains